MESIISKQWGDEGMKLGITLTSLGVVVLLAGLVFVGMNLIMGNLIMAIWCLIPSAILGVHLVRRGIGKLKRNEGTSK